MIILSEEKGLLEQLVDRDHRLEIVFAGGRLDLPATPGNQWARDEVLDWRARHPPHCHCWKTNHDRR